MYYIKWWNGFCRFFNEARAIAKAVNFVLQKMINLFRDVVLSSAPRMRIKHLNSIHLRMRRAALDRWDE
jgi:hypothetical protein